MNAAWIVVVARNNLALLKAAVASFEAQRFYPEQPDRRAQILVVNNGSTDGTKSWLHSRRDISSIHFDPQHSVSRAWNRALTYIFSLAGPLRTDRVLVCNQDVILRLDTYRRLEAEQAEFVTAVGTDDGRKILERPPAEYAAPRPHPDFSCFMISRSCYERVGPFDESYRPAWFEDNKYHVEMHRHGIRAYSIDLPFYHVGGGAQTLKRANSTEQAELLRAFERNKERFRREYGCDPADTKSYERLFTEESFGIYLRE